jgi:predicted dithiol-disulfide oxidoreductase (DUF899 family)
MDVFIVANLAYEKESCFWLMIFFQANLGQLVQFFTGHNNLMRYQFIFNNDVDSTCRLCQ